MSKNKIKKIDLSNGEEKIITSKNYNDDRTMAMRVKKQKHKKDSIAWMIVSILMFIFLVMSAGRLSVIGQFFDDVFFNMLFGWFKYVAYVIMFTINFSILFGLKYKIKKRFLAMIILLYMTLAWLFSTSLMIDLDVKNLKNVELWSEDMFPKTMDIYIHDWIDHSIFGEVYKNADNSKFGIYSHGYFNTYSGGGIIGALLTGAFGYTTLPFSLVLSIFSLFLIIVWMLTGNAFYLFIPKAKRKGKGIRILSLKYNDNPHKEINNNQEVIALDDKNRQLKPNDEKTKWSSINVFDENPRLVENEVKNADLTIDFRRNKEIPDDTFEFEEDEFLKTFNLDDLLNSEKTLRNTINNNHELTRQQMLEKEKERFENMDPKEARAIFEKEYSSVRPFGELNQNKTIETFKDFDEEAPDDTDFFNEMFEEKKPEQKTSIKKEVELEETKEPFFEKINNDYKLPSIDLLSDVKVDPEIEAKNKAEAESKAEAINNTFEQFNVGAEVVNVIIGPSVTKFEIQPAPGTKVNSISALENDLKLALASQSIRLEAPIQGKNLVGIEIENKSSSMVGLKEMMNNIPSDKKDSKLLFALGKNVLGLPVFAELNKMPHLLVAGSTGSGKSVMINALIISILLRAKPHEVKFLMIDPKKVELSVYSNLPHMLAPVISDMKEANNALKAVINEMDNRYDLFAQSNSKNIESYNEKQDVNHKLPYYVVIIDELADLMMTANKKDVEDSIMRITQMARAAGIHLIVATQRPSVDVITGVIKSNIPTRIAFSVTTGGDSRTILDSVGAEKLIGKGDMLYAPPGSSELIRAQGAYLNDKEIENIVNEITKEQTTTYNPLFMKLNKPSFSMANEEEHDELYDEIKAYVIEKKGASVSLVQRKFNMGYNRAAKVIDQLEEEGIVGPQNGSKPREILVDDYEIEF